VRNEFISPLAARHALVASLFFHKISLQLDLNIERKRMKCFVLTKLSGVLVAWSRFIGF
jgi:hypothetical protein